MNGTCRNKEAESVAAAPTTPKPAAASTPNAKAGKADKSNITCYTCNKTGHYSNQCPDKAKKT